LVARLLFSLVPVVIIVFTVPRGSAVMLLEKDDAQ
jgi:hypothetical protein